HGGELLTITTMLQHESHTFVETKLEREQALRFYEAALTYSNIISQPFPSDKKAFPVRWVIVAFSSIGAFLLSLLIIFVLENKRSFNDETA
ncbi:MAG: hypothetical protein Q8T08_15690, partial [Ignavibacteria bacterium]|nr:hypothetical protein [Ignavibacteria bacterium]